MMVLVLLLGEAASPFLNAGSSTLTGLGSAVPPTVVWVVAVVAVVVLVLLLAAALVLIQAAIV